MPVIPGMRITRQVAHEFKVSLGYITRFFLKKNKQQKMTP
jgi:hypothetical protein